MSPPNDRDMTSLPRRVISRQPTREEIEAEHLDPYAMGWDAGENLDDPPKCPFLGNGISAKLWRQGFSARVSDFIGRTKSKGGLAASLTS